MKLIRILLVLSVFCSCRSMKMQVPTPTLFEGDSLFFQGIESADLAYQLAADIMHFSSELKPGKKLSVSISYPTTFLIYQTKFTVYPGEHIVISIDKNGNPLFTITDNDKRNREFLFQSALQDLHQKIKPPLFPRTTAYSLDTILLFEQKVKAELPGAVVKANALLDSLATVYHISDSSRRLAKMAIDNEQYSQLYSLYFTYQQELKEHQLYEKKMRTLVPLINNIKERDELYAGASFYIENMAQELLPKKIRRIESNTDLREAIDTVNNNFKALARDYLLTKIMYSALYRRVPVSKSLMRYYYQSCEDRVYESVVRNFVAQMKKQAAQSRRKKDNRLIALSDAKIYTLEEVIARQKGKLVLLDIWASWCLPCLEQQPYMKKLQEQFAGPGISFIYLSMDKEMIRWQQRNTELEMDTEHSYLFENVTHQSFLKRHQVTTIPRYILIDQNGKIINADAPTPDSGALEMLIKKHLSNQ